MEVHMNYIVVVKGRLKASSIEKSKGVHDATIAMIGDAGKEMGNFGHRAHISSVDPREFLAIDMWDNPDGPQKLMGDPRMAEEFGKLFEGNPDVAVYAETDWKGW